MDSRLFNACGSMMLTQPTPTPSARAASQKFCTAQTVL